MRVFSDEEGAIYALLPAIKADGLRGREDMGFVERRCESGAAMAGGAEGDTLGALRWIGLPGEISRHQTRHIDQHRCFEMLTGMRAQLFGHRHLLFSAPAPYPDHG